MPKPKSSSVASRPPTTATRSMPRWWFSLARRPATARPRLQGTDRMDPAFVAYMVDLPVGQEFDPDDIKRANTRLARLDVFRAQRIEEGAAIGGGRVPADQRHRPGTIAEALRHRRELFDAGWGRYRGVLGTPQPVRQGRTAALRCQGRRHRQRRRRRRHVRSRRFHLPGRRDLHQAGHLYAGYRFHRIAVRRPGGARSLHEDRDHRAGRLQSPVFRKIVGTAVLQWRARPASTTISGAAISRPSAFPAA